MVVPRPGQPCDPAEVREFVRERVAAYKYPRVVVVAEALPHSPSGKMLRREIDRDVRRPSDGRWTSATDEGEGGDSIRHALERRLSIAVPARAMSSTRHERPRGKRHPQHPQQPSP